MSLMNVITFRVLGFSQMKNISTKIICTKMDIISLKVLIHCFNMIDFSSALIKSNKIVSSNLSILVIIFFIHFR